MSYEEDIHHTLIRRWICSPIVFHPQKPDGKVADSILLELRGSEKPLSALSPDDARDLCYKDCVIYLNVGMDAGDRLNLLDTIYFEWFPHRDRVQDMGRGNFFAGFLRASRPNVALTEFADFHFGALCPKLKELEPDILEKELAPFNPNFGRPRQKGLFRVRESLEKIFVVVDRKNWKEEGVCVVCRDEKVLSELEEVGEELEVEGLGKVKVARANLESVMRAVVADNEERKRGKREWSGWYDEWLGDDDDSSRADIAVAK